MPFTRANLLGVGGVMAETLRLFVKEPLQQFHPSLMLILNLREKGSIVQTIFKRPCTLQYWAKVNGVQIWIMLDSKAGDSYIGSYLLAKLNIKPCRTERRVIEQSMGQWTNELRYTTSMLNQMSLTVLEWNRVVMCQC